MEIQVDGGGDQNKGDRDQNKSLEKAILLEFITGGGPPCKLMRGCGKSKG